MHYETQLLHALQLIFKYFPLNCNKIPFKEGHTKHMHYTLYSKQLHVCTLLSTKESLSARHFDCSLLRRSQLPLNLLEPANAIAPKGVSRKPRRDFVVNLPPFSPNVVGCMQSHTHTYIHKRGERASEFLKETAHSDNGIMYENFPGISSGANSGTR